MAAPVINLEGRTALVTGGTGHIGRAICRGLAEAGARVLVNARRSERAAAVADVLRSEGHDAAPAPFDLTDEASVAAFCERDQSEIAVLVNNAYSGGAGSIETADGESYRRAYEVAVVGVQTLTRCLLPRLRAAKARHGDAAVINLASMYGLVSPDPRTYDSPEGRNPPFYGSAKAALIQWTRYAAVEFAPEGIRFNSVSPGPIPADEVVRGQPDFIARLTARTPMGRIGKPEEVAGPIVMLASPAASYITGTNLVIDGGWTAW